MPTGSSLFMLCKVRHFVFVKQDQLSRQSVYKGQVWVWHRSLNFIAFKWCFLLLFKKSFFLSIIFGSEYLSISSLVFCVSLFSFYLFFFFFSAILQKVSSCNHPYTPFHHTIKCPEFVKQVHRTLSLINSKCLNPTHNEQADLSPQKDRLCIAEDIRLMLGIIWMDPSRLAEDSRQTVRH